MVGRNNLIDKELVVLDKCLGSLLGRNSIPELVQDKNIRLEDIADILGQARLKGGVVGDRRILDMMVVMNVAVVVGKGVLVVVVVEGEEEEEEEDVGPVGDTTSAAVVGMDTFFPTI